MKLNKIIKKLGVTFFLALILSVSLKSQYIQYVEPSNVQQTADDIEQLFGGVINVNNSDIVSALTQMLADYDPSTILSPPEAEVYDVQNNSIDFWWQDVPGAVQYQTGYLNLEGGQTGSQYYGPGGAPYSIPVLNELHLFSFQSFGNSSSGGATGGGIKVVIVEVDIILQTGPQGDCECEEYDNIMAEIPDKDALNEYIDGLAVGSEFDLFIGPSDELLVEPLAEDVFNVHGIKTGETGAVMTKNIYCPIEAIETWGVRVLEDIEGTAVLTLDWDIYVTGSIAVGVKKCKRRRHFAQEPLEGEQAQLLNKITISPNPVNDYLNVKVSKSHLAELEAVNIYTVSGLLVAVYQITDTQIDNLVIPMVNFQAGIYFIELVSNDSVEKRTILKMD